MTTSGPSCRLYDEDAIGAALDLGGPEAVVMLDLLAPLVAAKALRDAADGYQAVEGNQHISSPARWLRRRADEIEESR